MMRPVRCLSFMGLGLLLAACSSAPTHFYTLVPPARTESAAMSPAPYRIAVLPVTIPAQVDQPQMVVRQGGGSVALLDGERWIAPLGDEIRTTVSTGLMRDLGTEDVYGLAATHDKSVYRIQVDVKRFESVPGQYTLLSATWSVHATAGKGQTLQCSSTIREPVGQGYGALVQGHQQGLEVLVTRLASAIRGMAHGHAACPASPVQSGS